MLFRAGTQLCRTGMDSLMAIERVSLRDASAEERAL
jgi:hypothetical protein